MTFSAPTAFEWRTGKVTGLISLAHGRLAVWCTDAVCLLAVEAHLPLLAIGTYELTFRRYSSRHFVATTGLIVAAPGNRLLAFRIASEALP